MDISFNQAYPISVLDKYIASKIVPDTFGQLNPGGTKICYHLENYIFIEKY